MSNVIVVADSADGLGPPVGVSTVRNTNVGTSKKDAGMFVTPQPSNSPSYVVPFSVVATAALDILTIGPLASGMIRLRRIVLVNPGSATGAIVVDLVLGIATSVGSGGAAATVAVLDGVSHPTGYLGGPDAGSSARTGDTTQATGFVNMYNPLISVSVPATAGGFTPQTIYDARDPLMKCVMAVPSWMIVLRTPIVGPGATGLRGYAEFTVDPA